jgi:hypothetical protein
VEAKDIIGDTVFTNVVGVDDGKGIMKVGWSFYSSSTYLGRR